MPQSTVLCRRRKVRLVSSGSTWQIASLCSDGLRREARPSTRKGFDTHMIEAMIRAHEGGDVRLNWYTEGLACEITLPT
jgi:hypothetical protein